MMEDPVRNPTGAGWSAKPSRIARRMTWSTDAQIAASRAHTFRWTRRPDDPPRCTWSPATRRRPC